MCRHCANTSAKLPFNVHGNNVPVPKSKCLWLNGDQSERVLRRQFHLIGVESGVDVMAEWDMQWYRKFCNIQKKHQYDIGGDRQPGWLQRLQPLRGEPAGVCTCR